MTEQWREIGRTEAEAATDTIAHTESLLLSPSADNQQRMLAQSFASSRKAQSPRQMGPDDKRVHTALEAVMGTLHSREAVLKVFRGSKRMARRKDDPITLQDLQRVLIQHGQHLNERQLQLLMSKVDTDGDGSISLQEFTDEVYGRKLEALRRRLVAASYSNGRRNLDKLFRHYDRDNDGTLTFEEFSRAVRRDAKITVVQLPDRELREVFEHVDVDGDGEIDLSEFKQLLTAGDESESEDMPEVQPGNKSPDRVVVRASASRRNRSRAMASATSNAVSLQRTGRHIVYAVARPKQRQRVRVQASAKHSSRPAAAVVIQSAHRGRLARLELHAQQTAATKIQAAHRGQSARYELLISQLQEQEDAEAAEAATRMQAIIVAEEERKRAEVSDWSVWDRCVYPQLCILR